MDKISFFTPVCFNNLNDRSFGQSLRQTVDSYFHLRGSVAHVIPDRKEGTALVAAFSTERSSWMVTLLKVASYCTLVLPLLFLAVKILLHTAQPAVYRVNARAELEQDIAISPELRARLERIVPRLIREQTAIPGVQFHDEHNSTFTVNTAPNLIFKMKKGATPSDTTNSLAQRYAHMIQSKEICLAHQLNQLVVPKTIFFALRIGGQDHTLIAEERLAFESNETAQERFYHLHAEQLTPATSQLATYILKMPSSHISWKKTPVIDTASTHVGPRRIAILDAEKRDAPQTSLFGSEWPETRRGFLRSLFTEAQIDETLAQARDHGIRYPDAQRDKMHRLEEIASDNALYTFYQNNGILANPRRLLQVNLDSLGFNLDEVGMNRLGQQFTLRTVASETIQRINAEIPASSPNASVKGRRQILLRVANNRHSSLGSSPSRAIVTDGDLQQLWIYRIIQALVQQGHLFKLEQVNRNGYLVQA